MRCVATRIQPRLLVDSALWSARISEDGEQLRVAHLGHLIQDPPPDVAVLHLIAVITTARISPGVPTWRCRLHPIIFVPAS